MSARASAVRREQQGRRSGSSSSRPFTLVAPALGFASGAVTAAGAAPRERGAPRSSLYPLIGLTMAAVLNAASNALNQIYDLEIDRINKPKRPLPSGRMTLASAWTFTLVTYAIALVLAWLVAPGGRHECFWIVLAATAITVLYSVPPFRTKRLGIWANVTIAIPRGVLLKVAGWSAVKTVVAVEPWFIGAIFGLFLLGASTTKDFADMEGDARGGCRTLPIIYGVRRAAWMISPSFVVPFLMIAVGALRADPDRQLRAAPAAVRRHDRVRPLRLLPDAAPPRRSGGRREPRLVGAHVPNDVRRPGRLRTRLPVLELCRGSGLGLGLGVQVRGRVIT